MELPLSGSVRRAYLFLPIVMNIVLTFALQTSPVPVTKFADFFNLLFCPHVPTASIAPSP
jgi:hypothetical protein